MEPEQKTCQNCKNQFVIEPDDFGFYETIKVPPPTWCPECRLMRRIAWWGYRILYKRPCDFTGENVISFYHPSAPHKIYRQDIWWSDKWDPKSYGRDYDFSRSFFEQFRDLFRAVPLPALHTEHTTLIDSDYCNAALELKNCYLCFKSDYSENCAYTNVMSEMKECFDAAYSYKNELCYEVVNTQRCYRTFFSQNCADCHDVYFSRDLVGCSNCIGCVNLRNKKYHIFNKPYSKEDYEKKTKGFDFGSRGAAEQLLKMVEGFMLQHPRRSFCGVNNKDISGDYISNSKNVHNSYMVGNGEDIRYSQLLKNGPSAKSYDHTGFGIHSEWIYESAWVGVHVQNVKFSVWNYRAHDLEYSFGCHGSENLFGCAGIRKGQYCILNKQYSKTDYEALTEKIRAQMTKMPYRDALGRTYRYGDLFPTEFCPWAYNETTAYEFFPLEKKEALAKGFSWRDPDPREYQAATIIVPDHIEKVTDDILKGILKCSDCGRNYQIIRMELDFYRRMNIPIPRRCPLCRDRARIKLLNPMRIYDRKCAKCGENIKTSYAPDRPEIVYCESCYNAEVV